MSGWIALLRFLWDKLTFIDSLLDAKHQGIPKLSTFQPLYQRKKFSRKNHNHTRKKYKGQTAYSESSKEARKFEDRVVRKAGGIRVGLKDADIGLSEEREV